MNQIIFLFIRRRRKKKREKKTPSPFVISIPAAQPWSDGQHSSDCLSETRPLACAATCPAVGPSLSPSPVAAPVEFEGTDGGRGGGVPAGAEGGAEARRRGRQQAALPRLRGGRVPRPRRHGGRRQGQAAARRGLRLPPHQRPPPQGTGDCVLWWSGVQYLACVMPLIAAWSAPFPTRELKCSMKCQGGVALLRECENLGYSLRGNLAIQWLANW